MLTPQYWHERAVRAQRLARTMTDPFCQVIMMEIAQRYAQMALRSEQLKEELEKCPSSNPSSK